LYAVVSAAQNGTELTFSDSSEPGSVPDQIPTVLETIWTLCSARM
jgi:hypothetical protein